jgi:hypothetical protein
MKRQFLCLVCAWVFLSVQANARADEIVVPAGTLLHCTLDEPNFSSATADVGDPVLCHLSSLQQFGHIVFPRGSYLAGHLEADKEPGHFVGKGYLKLQFDRVGLPGSEVPVPSKVIAARGFRVDRQGDIVGRGHPKRDAVEWMIPPLWPWKVLSLPARGPRPTLKGEEPLTLRLMDDIVVPAAKASGPAPMTGPGWHYFDEPASQSVPRTKHPFPAQHVAQSNRLTGSAPEITTTEPVSLMAPNANPEGDQQRVHATLLALKSDTVYTVTDYRVDGGMMNFVLSSGEKGAVSLNEVDWRKTTQLNAEHRDTVTPAAVQPVALDTVAATPGR